MDGQTGLKSDLTIQTSSGTETISYLNDVLGEEGTTYVRYRDTNCGPRCVPIRVFQLVPTSSSDDGDSYKCNITVSTVANVTHIQHELPDENARNGAAAIALTGFVITDTNDTGISFEAVRFNNATEWGVRRPKDPVKMAAKVSLFSIGSIANLDRHNPVVPVPDGRQVQEGVKLVVTWRYGMSCCTLVHPCGGRGCHG